MHRQTIAALLAIGIIVLAGLAAYASSVSAEPQLQDEYATYRNEQFGYSLIIPAAMEVSEERADSNGQTIVFKDPVTNQLFHVSALPYSQLDITLDKLEPAASIASDQAQHLEIVNAVREDVFKVWFTKNGVLYVVVTFPQDEQWLVDILGTWQFR